MASVSTDRRFGINSGIAIKVPCVAATTANITLSGEQTIDGVACVTGDRVLVKNQTTATENGIYRVDTGVWSRDADFDGSYDVVQGTLINVVSGTANGGFVFELTTADPVIGSSSLTFAVAFSSAAFPSAVGFLKAASVGGTVNAITATFSPAFGSWAAAADIALSMELTGANTSLTPTLAIDGLAAKTIVKSSGAALVPGDIPGANFMALVRYDASSDKVQLLNPMSQRRAGCVEMIRTANSTNDTVTSAGWKVYDENGYPIDTTGTTTDGLQEAINYAARYGYDLKVWGSGIKPLHFGQDYGGALGNNPFATTNGSNVVTVTHTAHGRSTGDKMTFNGLSGAVNNIPASEFGAEHAITSTGANTYTITLTTNANATGSGGGANCRWQDSGQDVSIISCTSGIVCPPIQGVHWQIHATINIAGPDTSGWTFDSCMLTQFEHYGQLVCGNGQSIGYNFSPAKELPQDGIGGPVITSSRFMIPSVVMTNASAVCNQLSVDNGAITDNIFDFIEPNGGADGVRVVFDASNIFTGNHIKVVGAHLQTSYGVAVGQNATGATLCYGNHWHITQHPAAGCVALDVWGSGDTFILACDDDQGTPLVGVKLESSATKNIIIAPKLDATTPVSNLSTTNDNTVIADGFLSESRGTWTPNLTFATPGDIAWAGTTITGNWYKIGHMCVANFVFIGTITHTTAAGNLQITNAPLTAANNGDIPEGALRWQGITKAGYTDITSQIAGGTTTINFNASGSGVARAAVTSADVPTGGVVNIVGTLIYFV